MRQRERGVAAEGPSGPLRQALHDEPHGPLPALLLALTVLAGVVDATSILRLGHVFVATMTGNLVFIGLAVAGAKGFSVVTPALALGGFVIGVLIGGRASEAARSHRGLALRNVLAIKLSLATLLTVVLTMTITGVLTERKRGWHDPSMLRRWLSLLAFAIGSLSGALLILNVGVTAALLFRLAILVSVTIAAHRVSATSASWATPRPA